MQRPNEKRRGQILSTAAKMFAVKPFHEVRLDDVASAARVGKGTLYIYFKSKEDLYFSLIRDSMDVLIARLRERMSKRCGGNWEMLCAMVEEIVDFAMRSPHAFQLTRPGLPRASDAQFRVKRKQIGALLEEAIRRGVKAGEMTDPHPELSGQFIPACVRAIQLYGPSQVSPKLVAQQILRIMGHGVLKEHRNGRAKNGKVAKEAK